jgi:hypothetical protein
MTSPDKNVGTMAKDEFVLELQKLGHNSSAIDSMLDCYERRRALGDEVGYEEYLNYLCKNLNETGRVEGGGGVKSTMSREVFITEMLALGNDDLAILHKLEHVEQFRIWGLSVLYEMHVMPVVRPYITYITPEAAWEGRYSWMLGPRPQRGDGRIAFAW